MNIDNESFEVSVQRRFLKFLNEFQVQDPQTENLYFYYKKEAQTMIQNERTTLFLNFEHLHSSPGLDEIAQLMQTSFYKYEPYFRKAIQEFIFKEANEDLQKVYFLSVHNLPSVQKIRELRANSIGQLIAIQGTVTRTTEVRPELISASFICLMCEKKIESVEQQFKFTEPKKCTNLKCDNRTKWQLDLQSSVFTDFQKLRVQEDSKDIPAGSMPRSVDIIFRNELCEHAKPGDKCVFIGMLTVVPDIYSLTKPGEKNVIQKLNPGDHSRGQTQDGITGLKQLGVRDLTYKNIFIANFVEATNNRFDMQTGSDNAHLDDQDDIIDQQREINSFDSEELLEIQRMRQSPEIYKNLADSIAPAVSGHEEIKKGILLMLVGGVNKKTKEGVNIRGDINVCIVGDPSTAKSQFLKFTCSFQPRAVYTSGKASSAAGLTASVSRDPETGEFCIEAGALMLADNGVCCIDEFDKMDSKDQVAIHEAMEQQTISMAKAGIHATLNARASILAAANPVYGRYDKTKPLKQNVNMSQPIMSRFDLFFIVVDQCTEFLDTQIANHIVKLHRKQEAALDPPYTTDQLRRYIRFARTYKPQFSRESAEYLRKCYVRLRQQDQTAQKTSYRITVRQLESLIRLSEALARVHCRDEISVPFVKEAEKLLSQSILQVEKPNIEIDQENEFEERLPGDNLIQEEIQKRKQEQQQKSSRLQIASDEYFKITRAIEQYFKEMERQRADEIQETHGILQQQVIEWYLEDQIEVIQTEEQLRTYERVIQAIINHMIKNEKILVIVRDNDEQNQRQLQLHPNIEF